jgi:hydrogenase nickel incorporation protein HypA/HybF
VARFIMHELSIALSIIDRVLEESRRRGNARVEAVHLRIGPLSGVDTEALRFAYDLACEDTGLSGSWLEISEVEVSLHCPSCGTESRAISMQQLCCSECGTPAAEIVHGRELELHALEIVE